MTLPFGDAPSPLAIEALRMLKQHHNVLISGPPAAGKSHLLAEIRHWFVKTGKNTVFAPTGPNVFPMGGNKPSDWLPSPEKTKRKLWSMTFHQGTKYRDFVRGIVPGIGPGAPDFTVTTGPLLEAATHALLPDCTSLVAIDEINRGPAVAVFGDLITAIETDKRLLQNGNHGPETVSVRVLTDTGAWSDLSLSHHLYIVAAMNEADTSVEPLDVAFRRRFHPLPLVPQESVLRSFFVLSPAPQTLPPSVSTAKQMYEVAVQAWKQVNSHIELARGAAFQIGHGIFMTGAGPPTGLPDAQRYITQAWSLIDQHVREVFFGDVRGIATVFAAGHQGSPYELREELFAESPVARLVGPPVLHIDVLYAALRAIAVAA